MLENTSPQNIAKKTVKHQEEVIGNVHSFFMREEVFMYYVYTLVIKITPSKDETSLQQFYKPGKKFSTPVGMEVTTKDNQSLIHKGALLLEVIDVYPIYKDFVASYPKIHPTPNGKVMSVFVNFQPPDSTLQNTANREKQTLVFVTIGPKIIAGWTIEMKEANISFLKHILM